MALFFIGADQAQCAVSVVILKSPGQHVLGTGEQHLLSVQLKKIRTFPHPAEASVILGQNLLILPVNAVCAAVEQDLAVLVPGTVSCHAVIASVLRMPYFRIPEIISAASLRQILFGEYRIFRQLFVIHAVSQGNALGLDLPKASVRLRLMEHAGIQ